MKVHSKQLLSKTQVKSVCIVRKILVATALAFLILSAILVLFFNAGKEPVMYFPIILGLGILVNAYRLTKTLKLQGGNISRLQFKYRMLAFSRSIFASMVYLSVVISDVFWSIFYILLLVLTLVCEFFLIKCLRMESDLITGSKSKRNIKNLGQSVFTSKNDKPESISEESKNY